MNRKRAHADDVGDLERAAERVEEEPCAEAAALRLGVDGKAGEHQQGDRMARHAFDDTLGCLRMRDLAGDDGVEAQYFAAAHGDIGLRRIRLLGLQRVTDQKAIELWLAAGEWIYGVRALQLHEVGPDAAGQGLLVRSRETKKFQRPESLTADDMKGINKLFIGTKGYLGTMARGESYSLLPRSRQQGHPRPPEVLKRSPGHYKNWIEALKGGEPACSNFTISGPYTEWMLLGRISWRFPNEKLLWDSQNLRFTNNERANEFVKPHFRQGWGFKEVVA